ncbi:MAG: ABC transporter permease [Nitrososphaeria archaeon]
MIFQRIIALVRKEMKKTFRDPAILFMIFLFPVVFVFAFGAFFGGFGGGQPVYDIGVVNMDQANSSQMFLSILSNTGILNLHVYANNGTTQNELSPGKIQAVMIIPDGFSQSYTSYQAAPNEPNKWINSTISLYLDKGSIVATQVISPIIQQTLAAFTGQNLQTIPTPIRIETASLVEVEQTSTFDFMTPGMFTFASIFLIMMVAQSFTEDRENGIIRRIRITPTTPTEFMTSQILSYMTIALIQAALVFAMVYLLGFRPNVGIPVYVLAFILVLIFSLSNVGFGLITATITKSSGAATGVSFIFILPQLFLGTFVGASLTSTAQFAGRFVPSYYVTDALTSLFLREAAIFSPTVLLDLAVTSVSCAAILVIGIVLYAKYYKI